MKVHLVFNRIPHHAGHSGYDQIARYLERRVAMRSLEDYMTRIISDYAWAYIAGRSSDWMSQRSQMDWYDTYSFSLEAAALLKLIWGKREIYHILYGENTYRYLGCLSKLARWKGSRLVCSYHQPPHVFDQVVRCKRTLQKLDAVIVVAGNQARYFASFVGEQKVFVVPHGVDTGFFTPPPERHGCSNGATAPEHAGKVCLFVGQWLRDFAMLEAVIKGVAARDPGVTFKVVTRPDYAQAFSGLRNVIALSGLSDSDLLAAYQSAELLLMPLTDCTANCALLEGLACGLPVVATDVGGIRDYVDPSCARLVPAGDVDGMCQAIVDLLADPRLQGELAGNSRRKALQFDWCHVADHLVRVYETVLK